VGLRERCAGAALGWRDGLPTTAALELGGAHPESIRMYRQEERRERDVRKQTQRAKRRDNKKRQSKLKRN